MRLEHPAEMPLGPGAWGYVQGGIKWLFVGFSSPTAALHYFLGEVFVQEPGLTLQLPASASQPRPSQDFWCQGPTLGGPRSEEATPASWLLLWPVSTLWPPPDNRFRSLEIAAYPHHLNFARPPSGGPASALKRQAGHLGRDYLGGQR